VATGPPAGRIQRSTTGRRAFQREDPCPSPLKDFAKPADEEGMDRRLEKRFQTNLAAIVTDIAAPDRVVSGRIVNVSQSGICAALSMRLAVGVTVKVQIEDCMLFGHIIYCDEEPPFRAGIEIVQVLIGESDLSRLVNAILAETMPNTPGVVVISTK